MNNAELRGLSKILGNGDHNDVDVVTIGAEAYRDVVDELNGDGDTVSHYCFHIDGHPYALRVGQLSDDQIAEIVRRRGGDRWFKLMAVDAQHAVQLMGRQGTP